MMEIATVIMVITFGMAMFYMIKGYSSKESSTEELTIKDEKLEETSFNINTESEDDLELLANTLETVVEEIVEESNAIKDLCVNNGTIEMLEEKVKEIPTILNETIEIDNSVNPEVEYRNELR